MSKGTKPIKPLPGKKGKGKTVISIIKTDDGRYLIATELVKEDVVTILITMALEVHGRQKEEEVLSRFEGKTPLINPHTKEPMLSGEN